jgi:hypothetical protein
MDPIIVAPWPKAWACSLPLIVLTVVLHAYGLGLLNKVVAATLIGGRRFRCPFSISSFLIGATALSVTVLHGLEGFIWAITYRLLGALPNIKFATLYSLNAMTTYGHVSFYLAPHWQMMGAVEALNGVILFGLTTAFLFTVIQRAWDTPLIAENVEVIQCATDS